MCSINVVAGVRGGERAMGGRPGGAAVHGARRRRRRPTGAARAVVPRRSPVAFAYSYARCVVSLPPYQGVLIVFLYISNARPISEVRYIYGCKGCPKLNTKFKFATIYVVKCWQPKKNKSTADSLELVKMERYTVKGRVLIVEQCFKNNESVRGSGVC